MQRPVASPHERAPADTRRAHPEVWFYPRRVDDPAPPAELTPSQAVHLAATPPAAADAERRVLQAQPPPAAPVAPAAPTLPAPPKHAPAPVEHRAAAPAPAPAPPQAPAPPEAPAQPRRPWWRRLLRALLPGRPGRHAAL